MCCTYLLCTACCRFGWLFENKCEIWQEDIIMELPTSREPVFYDPFLQTGPNTYYPVPVKVMNLDDANGYTENEGGCNQHEFGLVCRLIVCMLQMDPSCQKLKPVCVSCRQRLMLAVGMRSHMLSPNPCRCCAPFFLCGRGAWHRYGLQLPRHAVPHRDAAHCAPT